MLRLKVLQTFRNILPNPFQLGSFRELKGQGLSGALDQDYLEEGFWMARRTDLVLRDVLPGQVDHNVDGVGVAVARISIVPLDNLELEGALAQENFPARLFVENAIVDSGIRGRSHFDFFNSVALLIRTFHFVPCRCVALYLYRESNQEVVDAV
jgi:hypothetical protein